MAEQYSVWLFSMQMTNIYFDLNSSTCDIHMAYVILMAPEQHFHADTTDLWTSANGHIFMAHNRYNCKNCSHWTQITRIEVCWRDEGSDRKEASLHTTVTFHLQTTFQLWQWIGKGLSNCGRVSFQFVQHFHGFTDLIVILLPLSYNNNTDDNGINNK